MKNKYLIVSLLIYIFLNCESDSSIAPDTNYVIIQAFLYANKPVKNIRITSTANFVHNKSAYSFPPINDANVSLIKNEKRYDLVLSPGDSGYYHYNGTDLEVKSGDTFNLEVEYKNNIATARTVVPSIPTITEISFDTLLITDEENSLVDFPNDTITIKWDLPDIDNSPLIIIQYEGNLSSDKLLIYSELHYVEYENNDSLYVFSLEKSIIHPNFQSDKDGQFTFSIYYTNYQLWNFYYYSYDSKFNRFIGDSNITNGYGIFTALSGDSTHFYIKKNN